MVTRYAKATHDGTGIAMGQLNIKVYHVLGSEQIGMATKEMKYSSVLVTTNT